MDYIVIDGDAAVFEKQFGLAEVEVQDGAMVGSGHGTVEGAPICVEGDEAKMPPVGPVPYKTSLHTIPGMGLLSIDSLGSDQVASQTSCEGTAVILVGSKFNAKFMVSMPAQQPQPPPNPPQADTTTEYAGFGSFSTANALLQGI